jgi:antitoxin YefM
MDSLSISELRRRLPEIVSDVERTHNRVQITRGGTVAAVLVSPDDLEGLTETLEILADPDTMQALRDSQADVEAGRLVTAAEVLQKYRHDDPA